MCAIEVIRREKKKQETTPATRQEISTQELEQMITHLKVQIEEDKIIEEAIKE
jgi:hypothetical protein